MLRKYYPVPEKDDDPEKLKDNPGYKELRSLLRNVFSSKKKDDLERNYQQWLEKKKEYPGLNNLFKKMEEYYPKLEKGIENPQIPLTTNGVNKALNLI